MNENFVEKRALDKDYTKINTEAIPPKYEEYKGSFDKFLIQLRKKYDESILEEQVQKDKEKQ